MVPRVTDLGPPKKYRIVSVNKQVLLKATKRSFPGEVTEVGNLPREKEQFPSWEKAAGAQKAEDIMRETAAVVKMEACEEEDQKTSTSPEPFVGTLPFSFKCPKCAAGFHVISVLQLHMDQMHPGGGSPLWCHLCPKKYKRSFAFCAHLNSAHAVSHAQDHPGGYKCDECGGHFRRREDYAPHCQFFRGKPHFYCQLCNLAVYSDQMEVHMEKHKKSQSEEHGTGLQELSETKPFVGYLPFTFKCPKCEAGFYTSPFLRSHVHEMHHGTPPFWCHLCASKYKTEYTYWGHLEETHGVAQPKDHPGGYLCDECGGHYHLRHYYALHCQFFRGKPHFYCHPCNRAVFSSQRELHLEKHQKDPRNQEHGKSLSFCKVCKEEFCYREVEKHLTTPKHTAALGCICLECGKSGMDKRSYEEHREGLKEKPHAFCEPCGMVLDVNEWNTHQRAMGHGGRVKMRSYCCDLIFQPEEWEEHRMMECHRERAWVDKVSLVWKCPVEACGTPFRNASRLALHMALHPGVLPFPCRHCPKQFSHRPSRYVHEEMEHP